MTCHFIGIFKNDDLIGIALSQFLDLNKLESFGERDKCIKTAVRNFIFRNFTSHVLLVGNNMLTGQNAFAFAENIDSKEALQTLKSASSELKKTFESKNKKINITSFKDFHEYDIKNFEVPEFKNNYQFSTQPNMVFTINENWKSEQHYIDSLSKKYETSTKEPGKKRM